MTQSEVRVTVSGSTWMGSGIKSIETVLRQILDDAETEIVVAAYTISGAANVLFEKVEEALIRGCRVRMVINRLKYQHESTVKRLDYLRKQYSHLFYVYSFDPINKQSDLHAKVIVVDHRIALIGSSNLSLRGLLDNHEMGVMIEGRSVVEIAGAIEKLIESPSTVLVSSS